MLNKESSKGKNNNINLTKSKRISTRGVTSGTNARVNTFDNRAMQAQQQTAGMGEKSQTRILE
jgi:hypothetical protein